MSLSKEHIKEFVFAQYDDLVKLARKQYKLTNAYPEELVNEAIIAVFDVKIPFETEKQLLAFLQSGVKGAFWNEREAAKQTTSIERTSEKGEIYNINETKSFKASISPTKEFTKIYTLFETARFGKDGKKECPHCMSNNVYVTSADYKCASCFKKFSIKSSTYLHKSNLPYMVIYRAVCTYCRQPKVSSSELARWIGVVQKTAWYLRLKIEAAFNSVDDKMPFFVLSKLLTPKHTDNKPLVYRVVNQHRKKVEKSEIVNIIRLFKANIMSIQQLSELYEVDESTIRSYLGKRKNSNAAVIGMIKGKIALYP